VSAPCGYYTAGGHCRATPTRRYLQGPRCAAHSPAAVAGRPETAPDPALTLTGLRRSAGLADVSTPLTASALIDDRAIASGKRRASTTSYTDARAREEARRQQQKGA